MNNKFIRGLYFIIIPILLLGISLGYTSFGIALIAFVPLLFLTNRHTVGIFFIMYGGPLGGVIRAMYPSLPLYGLLFMLIGFILIRDLIIDLFRNNLQSFSAMALLLIIFGFFYLIGPQDGWAADKYLNICINGVLMIVCYYAYCQSTTLDAYGLFLLLFIAAVCMYAYMIAFMKLTPGSIFDYNWFREQSLLWNKEFKEYGGANVLVSYQHVGMLIAYSIAIILSQVEIKKVSAAFCVVLGVHAALMSGCRQAVLAIVVVIALRIVVFTTTTLQRRLSMGRVVWIMIGMLVAFFAINILLENVQSDAISSTLEEGDVGRQNQYYDAWNIFLRYPTYGAGIGGYHAITGDAWPHNLFLEALCETGVVGTMAIIVIAVVTFVRKRIGLSYLTESNMFYFLVIITLFIRVMVSADFSESIELFSAIFAITPATNNYYADNTE